MKNFFFFVFEYLPLNPNFFFSIIARNHNGLLASSAVMDRSQEHVVVSVEIFINDAARLQ